MAVRSSQILMDDSHYGLPNGELSIKNFSSTTSANQGPQLHTFIGVLVRRTCSHPSFRGYPTTAPGVGASTSDQPPRFLFLKSPVAAAHQRSKRDPGSQHALGHPTPSGGAATGSNSQTQSAINKERNEKALCLNRSVFFSFLFELQKELSVERPARGCFAPLSPKRLVTPSHPCHMVHQPFSSPRMDIYLAFISELWAHVKRMQNRLLISGPFLYLGNAV